VGRLPRPGSWPRGAGDRDQKIEVIHLTNDDRAEVTVESAGSARPFRLLLAGLGLLGIVVGALWLLAPDSGDEPAPPTTSPPVPDVASPAESEAVEPRDEPASATLQLEPSELGGGMITVAVRRGELGFWAVDLDTGEARELDIDDAIDTAAIDSLRFFGSDAAVALLFDGNYLDLVLDGSRVELIRDIDLASRASLGLEALTADGRAVWVGIQTGLIRWSLADDTVDARWIDTFGDRTRLPTAKGVIDGWLVVEASARTFLIDPGGAQPLEVEGEVIATAGKWLVVRSCDASLRCGLLTFRRLGTNTEVQLPADYRFRQICGLARSDPDGDQLLVVLQRLGSLVLLQIDPTGAIVETDLLPTGVACVDAHLDADGTVVVTTERGFVIVNEDKTQFVQAEELRPIVASGS
jgi:hypothetical protein